MNIERADGALLVLLPLRPPRREPGTTQVLVDGILAGEV
jgi:hypothetical protein